MMKKSAFFLLLTFLLSGNVWAVDAVSVELGNGNATNVTRVGAVWNWDRQWLTDGDWLLAGYWEATAGRWQGHSNVGNNQTVTELAVAPVFRLQQKHPSGLAPYVEGAVGLHLISPTFVHADRQLGSSLQFGEHIGFGVRFGEHQQFDLGIRFQHISNGGIKKPNNGINLSLVHFVYYF